MYLSFLEVLIIQKIIPALCWTLIHSLWQGLLLAILSACVMLFTKKSSAALRYNLLAALFLLFIGGACFTFARQWEAGASDPVQGRSTQSLPQAQANDLHPQGSAHADRVNDQPFADRIVPYLDTHASLIVAFWFIIFSLRFVQLLANMLYVQRIRQVRTRTPSQAFWQSKTQELAASLQIKKTVSILESGLIKVPLTVGFLKPLILFPVSFLSQLPAEEVEAILLHELAHIRRGDYLINLFQNFAEIIFFFNPGLLWLSSLLKDERENCCDDLAISVTRSRTGFVNALVAFQEKTLANSSYAMAFPGRKNHLLNRIKRIMTNNNKTLDSLEKTLLGTGIVLFGFLAISFSHTGQAVESDKGAKDTTRSFLPSILDTIPALVKISDTNGPKNGIRTADPAGIKEMKPSKTDDSLPDMQINKNKGTSTIKISWEGKQYNIIEANEQVVKLYIDGKQIPADKMATYQPTIDKIKEKVDETMVQQELQLKVQQDRLEEERLKLREETYLLKNQQNELTLRQNQLEEERNQTLQSDFQKKTEALNSEAIYMKLRMEALRLQDEKLSRTLLDSQMSYQYIPEGPAGIGSVTVRPVKPVSPLAPLAQDQSIYWMIDDLKKENIIGDDAKLSFSLNSRELIVNGKTQSAAMHKKFKAKYIKGPKDHIIYSVSKNSTHTDLYFQ
jgi:bla regulator protein blaR1